MWIMLNDCFLSIVAKDCERGCLLVRARRKGDIEKIFPDASVKKAGGSDYLYRAAVPRDEIKRALALEVDRVVYGNFKDSVKDDALHHAYLRCWTAMVGLQPGGFAAYQQQQRELFDRLAVARSEADARSEGSMLDDFLSAEKPKRQRRRSIKRGR